MEMRDILIYFWETNQGDWDKVYKAIAAKEIVDPSVLAKVVTKEKQLNYCTIIDDNYPAYLKTQNRPPMVIDTSKIEWWNNRQRYIEKYSCKIASFIYATAVLNSDEGNYMVSFKKINQRFDLDIKIEEDPTLIHYVIEQLEGYDGIIDSIDLDKDGFDIMLGTDYIANDYDVEDEE